MASWWACCWCSRRSVSWRRCDERRPSRTAGGWSAAFRAALAPTKGDYRYPTDQARYGYNAADLRELRIAADSYGLHVLVFLQTMKVRNPWPGRSVEVVNGSSGAVVVASTTAATLSVAVTAGQTYLVEQPSPPTTSLPFAKVTGTTATTAKHLGGVQIGL